MRLAPFDDTPFSPFWRAFWNTFFQVWLFGVPLLVAVYVARMYLMARP